MAVKVGSFGLRTDPLGDQILRQLCPRYDKTYVGADIVLQRCTVLQRHCNIAAYAIGRPHRMRHRIALIDHERHVAVDILERIVLGVWIAWNERADVAVRTGAMGRDIEFAVPLTRVFRIKNCQAVTGRSLVSRDAASARSREPGLYENEIRTVGKINRPGTFLHGCPTLQRAGEANFDASEFMAFDVVHGFFGKDLALFYPNGFTHDLFTRPRELVARDCIL